MAGHTETYPYQERQPTLGNPNGGSCVQMRPLRKKDAKWLNCCTFNSGMYEGWRVEDMPVNVAKRLKGFNFIRVEYPHNPVHKERYVATAKGRVALAKADNTP